MEKKLTFIHCFFFFFKFTCTSSITFLLERQPQDTCWSAELSLFDLLNFDQFCNCSFFFCVLVFFIYFSKVYCYFSFILSLFLKLFLAFPKVRNRLELIYRSNIRSRWYFKFIIQKSSRSNHSFSSWSYNWSLLHIRFSCGCTSFDTERSQFSKFCFTGNILQSVI